MMPNDGASHMLDSFHSFEMFYSILVITLLTPRMSDLKIMTILADGTLKCFILTLSVYHDNFLTGRSKAA